MGTDYTALIQELRSYTYWLGKDEPCSRDIHPPICDAAADAIQALLNEKEERYAPAELHDKG